MSSRDDEEPLWELSGRSARERIEMPTDDLLIAYREGRLSEAEHQAVERALSGSRAVRRRLAQLAGVELPPAPERIRQRLFQTPLRRSTRSSWWVAVAATVVGVAGLAFFVVSQRGDAVVGSVSAFAGLEFEVKTVGLAENRSTAGSTFAFPDTMIRVDVSPHGPAVAGLEFALYRLTGTRLTKVSERDGLTLSTGRSSASFRVPAAALVGTGFGEAPFFVAVGRLGPAPAEVALLPGKEIVAQLAEAVGGRAYESRITIRRP